MRSGAPDAGGPANGHDPGAGRGRRVWEQYVTALEALLALEGVRARRALWQADGADVGPTGSEAAPRVHYLEVGRGRPVVLVHGGGGGGANWFRVFGPLAERYRVLAPDLPGFGLSSWLEPGRQVGRTGAAWLGTWLDGLGVQGFDMVGTSLGGLLALRLAQRWPGRVGRLVLLSSAGLGRAVPWPVRMATLPGAGRWSLRPRRTGTRWLFERYLTSNRSQLNEARQEALVEYLYRSERTGEPGRMARALHAFCGLRGQHEIVSTGDLARVRTPTLVMWGGRDRFFPVRHGRRAAGHMARARFVVLPEAGHSPNWETPAAFNSVLLAFLSESEGVG
jgi:pimeloyl-ACP methyl ester carboxylesterase